MSPVVRGLLVTGIVFGCFALLPRASSSVQLRVAGAGCGAATALLALALGGRKQQGVPRADDVLAAALAPRFFRERRRTPRHSVRLPVRVRVGGQSCFASLLNVSEGGALLRLHPRPGQELCAKVGDALKIYNYPAGTVTRVGANGLYIEFSVHFSGVMAGIPAPRTASAPAEAALSSASHS
jgi:hypothetical protein